MAGHPAAGFKIEEPEGFTEVDMVFGGKAEGRQRGCPPPDFDCIVFAAPGGVRVAEIGNGPQDLIRLGEDLGLLRLEGSPFFPQPPALGLECFPFLGCRLADRFADPAGLLVQPVDVGLQLPPQQVEFGKPAHVGVSPTSATVFGDEFDVFSDKAAIEHGSLRCGNKWRGRSRKLYTRGG